LALPFFAATLFISAFLLFLVQPMIGKLVLPRLGGTPQVWNTCMMFFQTVLLLGYAYTHTLTSKLPTRRQLVVHGIVLLLPLLVLFPWGPFGLLRDWTPPPGANPIFSTLMILGIIVGLPFLVISTTAPLLQRWFAYTGHPAAKDPYFLYGASNLGSMLALLAYPVLIEPLFDLQSPAFSLAAQNWLWAAGYVVLAVLIGGCVFMVLQAPPSVRLAAESSAPEPPPAEVPQATSAPVTQVTATPPAARTTTAIRKGSKQRGARQSQRPGVKLSAAPVSAIAPAPPRPYELTWWRRLRWVLLAAVPSSLMLGVTTYISTDISAIPLFWVIPLALYLLSFILVFMRSPVVWTEGPHKIMLWVQPLCLLLLVWTLVRGSGFSPIQSITLCMLAFFSTALVCHGELAVQRPPTRYLTEFYLWMSVGGMLGGVFNGLLAPVLFVGLLEFPLAIVLAGLLRSKTKTGGWTDDLVSSAMPGLVDWLGDKGDELARGTHSPPSAAAGDAAAAAPPRREDLPPRGWLLHYGLDVILPVLLGLGFLIVLANATATSGWNWKYIGDLSDAVKNPLFRFWYNVMAMSPNTAAWWAQNTYQFLVFGVPLLICFLYSPRPLRFGLGVGAILLANTLYVQTRERESWDPLVSRSGEVVAWERRSVLHQDRSYFGILRVHEEARFDKEKETLFWNNTYLMHGTTHHGLNYQRPRDLRRLATTYYHRNGPVGVIMRQIDWFAPPRITEAKTQALRALAEKTWNTYPSDARLPASLVGQAAMPIPGGLSPFVSQAQLIVDAWSDPPYACVGLGTGTMASYARPYQHLTFYEIDNKIRSFSEQDWEWPDGSKAPFFNYVQDARKRGARIEIIMGDARFSMAKEQPQAGITTPQRDHYYRVIELDAFSSDAIPVHLITKEAIEMYFEKLIEPRDEPVDEVVRDKEGKVVKDKEGKPVVQKVMKHYAGGVLMVHTSNRHVDLVTPVTDIANSLGLKWRVGKDRGEDRQGARDPSDKGRFGSEYVMLAKDSRDLPPESQEREGAADDGLIWSTSQPSGARVWTDDYSNLLSVFRWR
jgi:hypothetical protein